MGNRSARDGKVEIGEKSEEKEMEWCFVGGGR